MMLKILLMASLVVYLLLVRLLRYRRLRELERRYQADTKLTPIEAQRIAQVAIQYETPFTLELGVQSALFKTYGIPSIAKLLLSTNQMSSLGNLGRRTADTTAIIGTFLCAPLDGYVKHATNDGEGDPRAAIAIARLNWIHGHYNISNDDYLYTLSLFIFEAIRWTERYEWRPLSGIEKLAVFETWVEVGKRMGIEDIPVSYHEFYDWAHNYEEMNMVPSEDSHVLGNTTLDLLLHGFPETLGIRSFLKRVYICLLDERLRIALKFPVQPSWLKSLVQTVLHARAAFVRHGCLPRWRPSLHVPIDVPPTLPGKTPRIPFLHREAHPWYYPEPRGLEYLSEQVKLKLGAEPSLYPGPTWKSQGYRLEEIGPVRYENEGHEEVMKEAERILGRPIVGRWSLKARCPF
ncbi:hypothetical protein SISNIDRAFT_451185 [Sistotremastrum niveocremeum HHB9708]|uniref:ER-bound oxygenase mpaB/mpaB'/Rubber oxygenase catalytic domain-containing protein n=1 Tax=Sistotremastrum niveocremeum HHB9708 TaxID=1314777 RepID=A0A164XZZ0_9AGAM|nr:hypothetical protein SISNIDRAFT_451185 [Sistotremastrum niveocremeum HHB9708]